jgi:hypothetical protein
VQAENAKHFRRHYKPTFGRYAAFLPPTLATPTFALEICAADIYAADNCAAV